MITREQIEKIIDGCTNKYYQGGEDSINAIMGLLGQENQWHTIDSAPKNGTEILLWFANEGCMDIGFYTTVLNGSWVSNMNDIKSSALPTHWMPLPEEPK